MSDSAFNGPPKEVYTRYASNDPIYSIYNNDYGMDLVWNYIPDDLDADVSFTEDYTLNTGQHCNNFFSFGPALRNVLRDICTVYHSDDLSMRVDGVDYTLDLSLNVNLVHSLPLGPDAVYQHCWCSTDSSSILNLGGFAPAVPAIGDISSFPSVFSFFVNYTEALQNNSLTSFDSFISKKMNDIYAIASERKFILDDIFGCQHQLVATFEQSRSVRANSKSLNMINLDQFDDYPAARSPAGFIHKCTNFSYKFINDLINTALARQYLGSLSFLMHPFVYSYLRSLDGDWGMHRSSSGQPLLCGIPVFTSEFMRCDANQILFGNFKQAFIIADFGAPVVRDIEDKEREKLTGQSPPYTYHDSNCNAKMFRHKTALIFFDENAVVAVSGFIPGVPAVRVVDDVPIGDLRTSSVPQSMSHDNRRRRRSRD